MRAGTESPQAKIDPGGRFILLTLPPGVSLPLEPLAAIAGQPLTPTAPSSSGGGVGSAPRSRVLGVQARVGAGRDWQTRPVALAVHLGDLEEQGYAAAAAGAVAASGAPLVIAPTMTSVTVAAVAAAGLVAAAIVAAVGISSAHVVAAVWAATVLTPPAVAAAVSNGRRKRLKPGVQLVVQSR